MSAQNSVSTAIVSSVAKSQPEYVAGLLDAQMGVVVRNNKIRVLLSNTDETVNRVVTETFPKFDKETVMRRPGKKTLCALLYTGEEAARILEFAKEGCYVKKNLATKALEFLAGGDADAVKTAQAEVGDDVIPDPQWVSGLFDVLGSVTRKSKKRVFLKMAAPKTAAPALELAHRAVKCGRLTSSGPARLLFETKEDVQTFADAVGDACRLKDIQSVYETN